MRKSYSISVWLEILLLLASGCGQDGSKFRIDYEKYALGNGLEVILHKDRSDPIVSVAILYHVGSNREIEGRTGFAHLKTGPAISKSCQIMHWRWFCGWNRTEWGGF